MSGDQWGGIAAHRLYEMFEFHGQRFGLIDPYPFDCQICVKVWSVLGFRVGGVVYVLPINAEILGDEIEGDPPQVGGDVEFSNAILGNAAGGEGGEGSVFEAEQCTDIIPPFGVGGADVVGDDPGDGLVFQGHDDVDVVGHEIGDDIDIGDAGTGTSHASGVDGEGLDSLGEECCQFLECRVEAFDMPDEEDDVVFFGTGNQLVALAFGGGQGFFDETVNAVIHQQGANFGVGTGWGGDADGIDLADDGGDGVESVTPVEEGGFIGVALVDIDDRYEGYPLELGVDPGVMSSHLTDTDDGDADISF